MHLEYKLEQKNIVNEFKSIDTKIYRTLKLYFNCFRKERFKNQIKYIYNELEVFKDIYFVFEEIEGEESVMMCESILHRYMRASGCDFYHLKYELKKDVKS